MELANVDERDVALANVHPAPLPALVERKLDGAHIETNALQALELRVRSALATGSDEFGLCVLGYGEISVVFQQEAHALKRLAMTFDAPALRRYESVVAEYVDALRAAGVRVAATGMQVVDDDTLSAYLVQPLMSSDRLLPKALAAADEKEALRLFRLVVDAIMGATGPCLGIDGQLANWVLDEDGGLANIDISTPFLRNREGQDQFDFGLVYRTFPWLTRGVVRLIGKSLVDKYFQPRGVLLDLLGNMHKERLTHLIPAFIQEVNQHVAPPITEKEAQSYYSEDARTYAVLQWLRRSERWVMRRFCCVYPYILAPPVDR